NVGVTALTEGNTIMNLNLAGKRALVTGGSRGIGRAIVTALTQQGVAVAATYRHESETAASLTAALKESQNSSFAVQADVSDAQAVANLAEQVRQRFGRLDILVNNASIISQASLDELALLAWQQTLDTNLTGVYLVTQAVMDMFVEGSSVINISSN